MVCCILLFYLTARLFYTAGDVQEDNTPFIADDENSYLEEQKDGSYIFHYAGFTDKVSKEDVESGGYEGYPIIKYKEK